MSVLNELFATADDSVSAGQIWEIDPPTEWSKHRFGLWSSYSPQKPLPLYGWKVHVSATREEAKDVLEITSGAAFDQNCHFKHLSGEHDFLTLHSKNSNRMQSGKFIALYPENEMSALHLMEQLVAELSDFIGLEILTDRSFRNSRNVYYRWGAFKSTGRINESGEAEELVPNGFGELVADKRLPQFVLPEGIVDPFCAKPTSYKGEEPHEVIEDFNGYRITSALRYTNSGGRYEAVCLKNNEKVFIKEARPNTGFIFGETASTRLSKEADRIRLLNHKLPGIAPEFKKLFHDIDYNYLVTEHITGTPLSDWVARESPLFSSGRNNKSEVEKYLDRSYKIYSKIKQDIKELHRIGVAFGDLSSGNIIISQNDDARLIDFEACQSTESREPGFGTPDYCFLKQGGSLTAEERDIYSLNCVALSFVLRVSSLAEINDNVLDILETELEEHVGHIPQWWKNAIESIKRVTNEHSRFKISDFRQPQMESKADLIRLKKKLSLGIVNSNQFDNKIIFPPNDDENGANFEGFLTGDGGVLWALKQNGMHLSDIWLGSYYERIEFHLKNNSLPISYGNGLSGQLDICHTFGNDILVGKLVKNIVQNWNSASNPTLANGLSGIALSLARHENVEVSLDVMQKALDTCEQHSWQKNGLFYGRSGVIAAACMFPDSFLASSRNISIIERLLEQEIAQTVMHPNGSSISLRGEGDGNRLLPYLSDGTAGLIVALMLADRNKSIKFSLKDIEFDLLAADLGTPFAIDVSLSNGVLGLTVVSELLQNWYPEYTNSLSKKNWERIRKYILPLDGGVGIMNPRTLKYDFSYLRGAAGMVSALLWYEGRQPLNLAGLYIDPLA